MAGKLAAALPLLLFVGASSSAATSGSTVTAFTGANTPEGLEAMPVPAINTSGGLDLVPAARGFLQSCADLLPSGVSACPGWAQAGYCQGGWYYEGQPVATYWCPFSCQICSSPTTSVGGSVTTIIATTSATITTTLDGGISTAMQALLARHNHYRWIHHDTVNYTWSPSLASEAQAYANQCIWAHSSLGNGENLYATSGSFDGTATTDAWYNEVSSYNYNNPGFSEATGHFTQVVWAGSTSIGCGSATCANILGGAFVVCEYSPPGNVQGEFATNVLQP